MKPTLSQVFFFSFFFSFFFILFVFRFSFFIYNILGFDKNFNMMLPFILMDCKDGTTEEKATCKDERRDVMIIMMAMQTHAPGTTVTANSMLPLMMMSEKENNELILTQQMSASNTHCLN